MSASIDGPTPGFLVWRLSMKWRVAIDRALAPLGLTHAQYSLVASLQGMEHAGTRPSQRALADHTGLEPLYVSKLARSLEAAGLVERAADPSDSRAVRLSLTGEGRAATDRAVAVVRELVDGLLAPLGGLDGPATEAFTEALRALLDVPVPPVTVSREEQP
ncbi:MarR family transcriptional regulator [Streptomyces sp. OfavH-34-F]|uniref:MarR family winged helix-turn-helix transcriptional regulator n=1 Tax=Streptomyces sp. OfavH-34-F TaxID=2917760 RepID=UPI001EF2DC12|nr:MarR family transcriptional regulator [Streptomyces sp. OfavH-34-F]MCG7529438.1 MarR family transcriptional regulator [Streptomyces sp. OfavH-34-F]